MRGHCAGAVHRSRSSDRCRVCIRVRMRSVLSGALTHSPSCRPCLFELTCLCAVPATDRSSGSGFPFSARARARRRARARAFVAPGPEPELCFRFPWADVSSFGLAVTWAWVRSASHVRIRPACVNGVAGRVLLSLLVASILSPMLGSLPRRHFRSGIADVRSTRVVIISCLCAVFMALSSCYALWVVIVRDFRRVGVIGTWGRWGGLCLEGSMTSVTSVCECGGGWRVAYGDPDANSGIRVYAEDAAWEVSWPARRWGRWRRHRRLGRPSSTVSVSCDPQASPVWSSRAGMLNRASKLCRLFCIIRREHGQGVGEARGQLGR